MNTVFSSSSIKSLPSSEEGLFRLLNTAVVRQLAPTADTITPDLKSIRNTAALQALLHAIRELARAESISEKDAAEQIVRCFRELDLVWEQAIFHSGVQQILEPKS